MKSIGEIEIVRPPSRITYLRKYTIFLNGRTIGKIKDGETVTYSLAPREYDIFVKFAAYKSNNLKVLIEEGKKLRIKIDYEKTEKWKLYTLRAIFSFIFFIGLILNSGPLISIGVLGFILGGQKTKPYLSTLMN